MVVSDAGNVRFVDERAEFEAELDAYYGADRADIRAWEHELHAESARHPRWSPYRRKAMGYRFLSERCPVHIFRHCPFYFELGTGRPRTDLGSGGLGGWLKREPFGAAMHAGSVEWWTLCGDLGLSTGWPVLDDNHHTVGYEKVLRLGLRGLIREAEAQKAGTSSSDERAFLSASIVGCRALMRVARRLAGEAERLLEWETDAQVRLRLQRIAGTARRVPAEPARTFYEALNTILFVFHVLQSIEGNGISVLGHVDRLLIPYYRRDIASGCLTEEDAAYLVGGFLAIADARFGLYNPDPRHVGTNTTIMLGGCDRDGRPVFNELTRLFLAVHRELGLIDPKVNARASIQHPDAYIQELSRFQTSGGNSLAIFNDDTLIAANVRAGKAVEDSRLYVGGGCQENVLEECEINSRATMYLNLAHVLLMGFFPERWGEFFHRAGATPDVYRDCPDYDTLEAVFLANLKCVVDIHISERNRTEQEGVRFNPCPIHSATLADCLARRTDMMAGGCRYSQGSVSLAGIGTVVDSLYAIKNVVFDQGQLSIGAMGRLAESDFSGQEGTRAMLTTRIAKFGQDDPRMNAFSARVFAAVADAVSGRPNSRGGRYEASLFPFRLFARFGEQTGATPDGRRAAEHLSPGMGPSLLALGRSSGASQVLGSLEPLDLTLYPVVAVLDVKLPAGKGAGTPDVCASVIMRFLRAGGSVLQMNCVDQQMLIDAREHPERHPDLVVRVSGYSSRFVSLAESIQDEIIERTILDASAE